MTSLPAARRHVYAAPESPAYGTLVEALGSLIAEGEVVQRRDPEGLIVMYPTDSLQTGVYVHFGRQTEILLIGRGALARLVSLAPPLPLGLLRYQRAHDPEYSHLVRWTAWLYDESTLNQLELWIATHRDELAKKRAALPFNIQRFEAFVFFHMASHWLQSENDEPPAEEAPDTYEFVQKIMIAKDEVDLALREQVVFVFDQLKVGRRTNPGNLHPLVAQLERIAFNSVDLLCAGNLKQPNETLDMRETILRRMGRQATVEEALSFALDRKLYNQESQLRNMINGGVTNVTCKTFALENVDTTTVALNYPYAKVIGSPHHTDKVFLIFSSDDALKLYTSSMAILKPNVRAGYWQHFLEGQPTDRTRWGIQALATLFGEGGTVDDKTGRCMFTLLQLALDTVFEDFEDAREFVAYLATDEAAGGLLQFLQNLLLPEARYVELSVPRESSPTNPLYGIPRNLWRLFFVEPVVWTTDGRMRVCLRGKALDEHLELLGKLLDYNYVATALLVRASTKTSGAPLPRPKWAKAHGDLDALRAAIQSSPNSALPMTPAGLGIAIDIWRSIPNDVEAATCLCRWPLKWSQTSMPVRFTFGRTEIIDPLVSGSVGMRGTDRVPRFFHSTPSTLLASSILDSI